MFHHLKVAQAMATSLIGGGHGMQGTPYPKQPSKPIRLYEMEGCPYCRRVREVVSCLNLDVEIYPCPKNGTRYRPEAEKLSGKAQFPLMVDTNTGTTLLESQAIIDHLFLHYGNTGKTPSTWQHLPEREIKGTLGSLVSGMRGLKAKSTNSERKQPEQNLELWSFEASPFSRLVRERLCELELPYVLHNVAKERWQDMGPAVMRFKPGKYLPLAGGKREKLYGTTMSKMQVPYLVDPNTGIKLYESRDILAYLDQTYG